MLRKLLGKILGKAPKADLAKTHGAGQTAPPRERGHGRPKKSGGPHAARSGHKPGGGKRPQGTAGKASSPRAAHAHGEDRTVKARHEDPSAGASSGDGKRRRRRRGGRGRRREHRPESAEAPARPDSGVAPADTPVSAAPEPVTAQAEPVTPIEVPAISEDNEFSDLGLEPRIVAAVEAKGYQQPTPIQSEAIPVVLAGRDVIGSAQTGTGKTAAFALPILQKLGSHGALRCLVLEPTRELALQVDEAVRDYGRFTNLRHTVIFGGVGYGPQRDAIRRGLDLIVATPGRLLDHIGQGDISLKSIQYLVLDEVDRMLDMGFLPDVKRIIELCPKERQTLFFSATIPPELEKLTQWCLRDPHTIEIGRRRAAAETVSHAFYPVIESQKFALLQELLERTHYESVLIFCRTKQGADFVAGRLKNTGHKVAVMHSNRSQSERMDALKGFKSGKYEVLVATDLAARGLDIAGITHVINYDTPQHAEDYVHRIGRTGRAQSEGDAFTLLTEDELKYAHAIERFIGQKVPRKKLENFPYQYSAIFEQMEGEPKNVFRSRLYRGSRK